MPSFMVAPTFAATRLSAIDTMPRSAPDAFQPPALAPLAQDAPPHPRKLDSRPQPLAFVANVGQANPKVRLLARSLGGMLFFADNEIVLAVAANITAQLSEAVTGVSATSFTLTPQAGGAAIPANVTLDAAGRPQR